MKFPPCVFAHICAPNRLVGVGAVVKVYGMPSNGEKTIPGTDYLQKIPLETVRRGADKERWRLPGVN